VGRGAARGAALDARRSASVAFASGALTAILAPLVLGAAVPDSYTPFLIFTLLAVLLVPPMLGIRDGDPPSPAAAPRWQSSALLGVALGGAYLSRQEAIWVGLTVLILIGIALRSRQAGQRSHEALERLWPAIVGGAVVVLPWLARGVLDFGSPLPGQAIENMFLVRNEDIFAFATRPSAHTYLAQGVWNVLANPVVAAWTGLSEVILLMAFPVGVVGLLSLAALRRSPALRRPTALSGLLVSGGLTLVATALLFPVATRWGTFMHASGPLVVGLAVTAALGADSLVARISRWRRWSRPNIVLGPMALLLTTLVFGLVQVLALAGQTQALEARYGALASAVRKEAGRQGVAVPDTLISDHPMWLADALGRNVVALPDEDLVSLTALSRRFLAPWVVVVDGRGRYPGSLLTSAARACLTQDPVALERGPAPALLFQLADTCPP
jgi:hypothetical protein